MAFQLKKNKGVEEHQRGNNSSVFEKKEKVWGVKRFSMIWSKRGRERKWIREDTTQ